MKKFLLLFFASFTLLFLFSGVAQAAELCKETDDMGVEISGLVPCGVKMNPPPPGSPAGTTGTLACPCELGHFFIMIKKIYIFITWSLALPLAGLLIVIGGVLLILSGANQHLFDTGKRILWGAAIGAALIFGAWVIVSIIFSALGYGGSWFSF